MDTAFDRPSSPISELAHRLTGFSSMDTSAGGSVQHRFTGAPPDGFLIDGHDAVREWRARRPEAHRLTGFSSMDTAQPRPQSRRSQGAPPDGFLIDGHILPAQDIGQPPGGAPPDGFLIDGHCFTGIDGAPLAYGAPPDGFLIDGHSQFLTQFSKRLWRTA